jgi:prolyl 4-hydroxylase
MEEILPQSDDAQDQYSTLNKVESLRLTFYKGSYSPPIILQEKVGGRRTTNVLDGGDAGKKGADSIDWQEMRVQLYAQLGLLPEGKLQQPWAVFTPTGERIVGDSDEVTSGDGIGSNQYIMSNIIASGMIIVTQGGNWVWPGVREGFQRTVSISSSSDTTKSKSRNVTIETLSMKPLVLSIQGFLTDEECDHIAEKAAPSMQYSGVTLKDDDIGKAASNWRTSQSTFLSAKNDPILMDIEYRTASLTRVPRNHQEYVQVLRYGFTEKYDAHHDFFDPTQYQSDQNTLNLIEYGKKNRFATVFWYLTDVEDGGHTIFPRAGGLPPMMNFADCSRGLKVKPQKGKVIIFYSLDASGARDALSLHGACPVGEGNVKWAANKWVWNAPMGYITS